ncbi:adenylate/guanylate cyclase domain-containing protein [Aestuariibaculum sp. YM273]|uniref:adenylate/guanylate cyclase domain-containing protein n=1 Tax=Aestuariibaculum sp. YM273 TaxID=3070659 RepID=UPI0027DB15DC|nr:adenylate/guanylate cyclase domain-containing protein [Aestuariibaculum sp. YM273]WMI64164.1 adenylate/guanylate cyclase domain-containing protein [Aestuariibaculum sp. YM273]
MQLRSGIILVCFFFFLSFSGMAQNSTIDSLKHVVNTGVKDTSMVINLNDLSREVLNIGDINKAHEFAQRANELATSLDYKRGKGYALKYIGLTQYFQGKYLDVLNSWTESLKEFESINDTIGMANLVNNLGAVYYSQGSNVRALDYYLRSLNISEKLKDPLRISSALLNIGGLYAEMGSYDKALEYYNRCNDFKEELKDPQLVISYLMGVGEVYFKKGLYDEALYYYQEALSSNDKVASRADILIKTSRVLLKKNDIEESIKYLNEAYNIAQLNALQLDEVQALYALGEAYKYKDITKSIEVYEEAEILAKRIEANDELRDVYKGLSSAYALNQDFKKAYQYKELYVAKKDSLFNLETDDKIRGLQFDFDLEKKEDQIGLLEKESEIQQLKQKRQKSVILVSLLTILVVFISAVGLYKRYKFVKATNLIIEQEKKRSDNLLHNILPEETAVELKEKGKVEAKKFESVTVLFTDFKGFTYFAKDLSPEELVNSVDYYFSRFDQIMEKYGIEKIKTIGDAYMCAGGLPFPTSDHPFKVIMAAFEIARFIDETKRNAGENVTTFDIRIGVNTGPIVAGVVGIHKFAYDIWGDTVNVASRMETLSDPGRINISENTYEIVKDVFDCKYRGEIEVKNRGMMKMYFVNGVKDQEFLDRLQLKKTAV